MAPDGRESVTVFVNGKAGSSSSWVYEFDIKLAPQQTTNNNGTVTAPDDSVFETTYRGAPCNFLANAQGGARAIGHSQGQGVWLVASGVEDVGLTCTDEAGGSSTWSHTSGDMYDPFTYITVQ